MSARIITFDRRSMPLEVEDLRESAQEAIRRLMALQGASKSPVDVARVLELVDLVECEIEHLGARAEALEDHAKCVLPPAVSEVAA